jgi:hypothetical protein
VPDRLTPDDASHPGPSLVGRSTRPGRSLGRVPVLPTRSDVVVPPKRPGWVYVAGLDRSGSTLLGSLLTARAGAFYCGELYLLWRRILDGARCECGAELSSCEIWADVAVGVGRELGMRPADAAARLDRMRRPVPDVRRPRPTAADVALRRATERSIERVTGATVVVDSSKHPEVLATAVPRDRPLLVVHLVRDPRAVAYSSLRAKADPSSPGTVLPRRAAWRTAVLWNRTNLLTEAVVREARRRGDHTASMLVTYEALAAAPDTLIDELGRSLAPGGPGPDRGWHHAVAANPSLYDGPRPVVADRRWEQGLSRKDSAVASVLTAPLLGRYGYPLRPGRSRADAGEVVPGAERVDGAR